MPSRVIRDGVLDSQRYHDVDKPARLAFLELLLCADDYGLVPLSDVYLKRHTTAFDAVPRAAADAILGALIEVDLLRMYTVEGARFAFIPRFGNHPRAKKPKWPLPPTEAGGNEIKHLVSKMHGRRGADAAHPRANAPETETETETETLKSLSSTERSPSGKPAAAKATKKVSTKPVARRRCPTVEEWPIPRDLREWGRSDCPLVDLVAETKTFRDHEFAKARSDWPATWRNWMRKEQKRLAELARRSSGSSSAKSFRQTDGEQIASSLSKLTGGLLGRRPSPQGETLDMENPDVRIGSD